MPNSIGIASRRQGVARVFRRAPGCASSRNRGRGAPAEPPLRDISLAGRLELGVITQPGDLKPRACPAGIWLPLFVCKSLAFLGVSPPGWHPACMHKWLHRWVLPGHLIRTRTVMPQSPGAPGGISFSLSRGVVENAPDKLKLIPQGVKRPPETEALPKTSYTGKHRTA